MTLRESAAKRSVRGDGHVRAEEQARTGRMSVGSCFRRQDSKAGYAQQAGAPGGRGRHPPNRLGDFERELTRPEKHLAWCATRKRFHFTFVHGHPDSPRPEALGGWTTRQSPREVLAHAERVGRAGTGKRAGG
ncbi:hypothetical protein HPC49_11140 [Pyxidicoccus fallax]|nr:hypothetical protein [Pyxidicoccus fallax]